jgi:hypothetical protein
MPMSGCALPPTKTQAALPDEQPVSSRCDDLALIADVRTMDDDAARSKSGAGLRCQAKELGYSPGYAL